jgi:methionyl-tRNA formyltransferase
MAKRTMKQFSNVPIMKIIFFGSTSDSVLVLKRLYEYSIQNTEYRIVAVVTQPAKPVGRDKIVTETPVAVWANEQAIPVLSFQNNAEKSWLYENEQQVIDTLQPFQADILFSASYGQKIPTATIQSANYGGLNVHPSILPRWRGADPVPWAILMGDAQIGVSIVTIADTFDAGIVVAQKKIPLLPTDFSDPVRTNLFSVGASLLLEKLPDYVAHMPELSHIGKPQDPAVSTYARRFVRNDGYTPWEFIGSAIHGNPLSEETNYPHDAHGNKLWYKLSRLSSVTPAILIDRMFRALHPWPGVWTEVNLTRFASNDSRLSNKTRMKILDLHLERITDDRKSKIENLESKLIIDTVQLEGKKPVSFAQFAEAYLVDSSLELRA